MFKYLEFAEYKFFIGVNTSTKSIVLTQFIQEKPTQSEHKKLRVLSVKLAKRIEKHFSINLKEYGVKVTEETTFIYITKDKLHA